MSETRSFPFTVERAETTDAGLLLEGYAAVFNAPTEIYGETRGMFTEVIAPGAFTKTISERTPVLQFDHGQHPLIGQLPLGVIQHLREDEHGLFVRARLSDNWLVAPFRDAIRDGAVTGMSFKFAIPQGKDSWDAKSNTRTVHEVILYELGPVVFPAYRQTEVAVRSELLELLSNENVRSELAQVLTFGVVEADREVTSDTPPDEPAGQPLVVKETRLALYRHAIPLLKELQKC